METTQNVEGLEDFGSSQSVSNISDFLSLEELGITESISPDGVELTEVEKPVVKEEPEVIMPLEALEDLDINLGDDDSTPPINTGDGFDYKSIVKDLVSNGVWDEIGAFETEDGEIAFEDMDIDKDTFVALMKHNQDEFRSKVTESTVSTEGISDFTQKLINIEKHGGNVQQALQAYQTIKEPLNNLDITDVKGQRAVCYLRLQQQGINGEEAKDLIESYEMKGVLEDKATGFKEQLDGAFDNWMASQEEKAIEEEAAYRTTLKNYRSSLNETLKNAKEFELSETHRRKLIDIATKEDENGDFEIDTLIDNHRRNPVDAADLILFLTDKEAFIQTKSKALLDNERKTNLKTIGIISKGRVGVSLPEKAARAGNNIMSLDKL